MRLSPPATENILPSLSSTRKHEANLYQYVGNNPMSYVDPSGLFTAGAAAAPLVAIGPIGWILIVIAIAYYYSAELAKRDNMLGCCRC